MTNHERENLKKGDIVICLVDDYCGIRKGEKRTVSDHRGYRVIFEEDTDKAGWGLDHDCFDIHRATPEEYNKLCQTIV